jgi:hypothetical protein
MSKKQVSKHETVILNEAVRLGLLSIQQSEAIRDLIKADGKKEITISGQTNPDLFEIEIN